MKAYFEYEDGTFWAIRTEGNDCLVTQGSKYLELRPDLMLKIGTEEAKYFWMFSNGQRITFADPAAAEMEGQKMADEKRSAAIPYNAEFWRIAIEKVLSNLIERETDPVQKYLAQAKKAAVASIYSGDNPRVLFVILCAYFDEGITRELEKYSEEL